MEVDCKSLLQEEFVGTDSTVRASQTLRQRIQDLWFLACEANCTKLVKTLYPWMVTNINCCNDPGYSALGIAADYGHLELAQLLLSWSGVEINAVANNCCRLYTALHVACRKNHLHITKLLLSRCDILVNTQARNIDDSDNFLSVTPLELACSYGSLDCVLLLLQDRRTDLYCNNCLFLSLLVANDVSDTVWDRIFEINGQILSLFGLRFD